MGGLYRSRERLFTGVAAGVGERLGINSMLVRLVWLCSVPVTFFLSAVAYLALSRALPEAPEGRTPARRPAFVPQAFALFVLAHGLIHVMGFLPAWRLLAPKGFAYSTLAFYGQLDLGDAGAKVLGLAWVAVMVAYVVAAVLIWRGSGRAAAATVLVSVASAAICLLALPLAQAGLVIDVAIVALVLVTPRAVLPPTAVGRVTSAAAH